MEAPPWVGYALGVLFCLLLSAVGRLRDHDVDPQHSALTAHRLWHDVPLAGACTPHKYRELD